MNKIYYLATCSTCQRIMKESGIHEANFQLHDIKTQPITPEQLDSMKEKAGNYEALFSRRSMKYKEMGLKDKPLDETAYRQLILEEYTFLKRPVIWIGNQLFVGNEKKTIAAMQAALGSEQ